MSRKPEEKPAGADQEPFLSRWSRKKTDARREQESPSPQRTADPGSQAPELPPIDKLTFESDYRGFFHPGVGEDTRRAALKKLFSDPHFSAIDMMDVYIDDYSKPNPIPAAMLAGLKQAQDILARAKEITEEGRQSEALKDGRAQALEPPARQSSPAKEPEPGTPETAAEPPESPARS